MRNGEFSYNRKPGGRWIIPENLQQIMINLGIDNLGTVQGLKEKPLYMVQRHYGEFSAIPTNSTK